MAASRSRGMRRQSHESCACAVSSSPGESVEAAFQSMRSVSVGGAVLLSDLVPVAEQ